MISRINISLPDATLRRLDRAVPEYKRSQAIMIAVNLALSVKDTDKYQWAAAFKALCKS